MTDKVRVTMLVDIPEGMEGVDVDICRAVEKGLRGEDGFSLDTLEDVVDVYPVFQVEFRKVFEVRAPTEEVARQRAEKSLALYAENKGYEAIELLDASVDYIGY